jgi:pimeloyl-ACP methyl ester carboxylesterase
MATSDNGTPVLPHEWHGDGEPLVLVAGLGGKGTSWRPFLETAARHFRVLTFDLPGSGRTPPLAGPVSLCDLARALQRLLDDAGLERVRLVGRSMGGMIAQELALLAPERVERLVLVSTTGRCDPHLASVFRLWAQMAEAEVPAEIRHRSSMLWCLGADALADPARAELYLGTKRTGDRPKDYALAARACAEHDALGRLADLGRRHPIPTLVVAGADDRLTPLAHGHALAGAIPGAALEIIPRAGHLPYLEAPAEFDRAVLGFLQQSTEEASPCRSASTT